MLKKYTFNGYNTDTDLSDLNGFNSKGNDGDLSTGPCDRLMVTAVDASSKTFTVKDSLIVGDGVNRALSSTPYATCPYPWTGQVVSYSLPEKYDASKFLNSQPSGGFLESQKPMGSMFKITWDLSDHEYWTGLLTI